MARYTLRLQIDHRHPPEIIEKELLSVVRGGMVDEVMLMIFLNEYYNGHETLAEISTWLELLRPWKKLLEREGLKVSLNPGHTIGQTDRGRRLKPDQDWQTMVDWKGQQAQAVVCPLDPGWRTYYSETLRLFAVEGYRVIWLEDDLRLANHSPLDWGGCFCPLHVVEFNRRAATSADRNEIVEKLLQPGTPHPWRAIWLDMWDETQTAMVDEWRQVVEPYGCRLGLMSSGPEMHAMEGRHWSRWWEALAGDNPPIHRPHFTGYGDMLGSQLPGTITMMDLNHTVIPPGTEFGPEIENSPHGWSKSYRQTAAVMMVAQVFGAECLNISLFDYPGNLPSDDPGPISFLSEWKPTLNWLSGLFPPDLASQGIGCPWSEEMAYQRHTTTGKQWMELHTPTGGWPNWLGGFGHAFQIHKSEYINALSGGLAWAFNDEEIRWMLQRGLLLDGPATAVLVERGFSHWLGVDKTHFITQNDALYVVEETTDPDFSLRVGALISVNDRSCSKRLLQGELMTGARIVSILRDPKSSQVGHGVIIYENELGGRVAVCPWDVNTPEFYGGQRNVQRAAQINALVRYLSNGHTTGSASGAPWLVPQFLGNESQWRGVVWNAYPDAVDTFCVELPEGMELTEIVQVNAHGKRFPCKWDGKQVRLNQPMHQWECVVLY